MHSVHGQGAQPPPPSQSRRVSAAPLPPAADERPMTSLVRPTNSITPPLLPLPPAIPPKGKRIMSLYDHPHLPLFLKPTWGDIIRGGANKKQPDAAYGAVLFGPNWTPYCTGAQSTPPGQRTWGKNTQATQRNYGIFSPHLAMQTDHVPGQYV